MLYGLSMGAEPKKPSVNFQLKTYEARLCLLHFTTLTHTGKLEPLEKKETSSLMHLASIYKWLLLTVAAFQRLNLWAHEQNLNNTRSGEVTPCIMAAEEGIRESHHQRHKSLTKSYCNRGVGFWRRWRHWEAIQWIRHTGLVLFRQPQGKWSWQALELTSMRSMKGPEFYCLNKSVLLTDCILLADNKKKLLWAEIHPCRLYTRCGL